jgi:uncharacterized membrane protein
MILNSRIREQQPSVDGWRNRSMPSSMRFGLFAFYALAGVAHLVWPEPFIRITPDWVPDKPLVMAATGILEIAAGACLLLPPTRKWASLALALYTLAVWPANFRHAMEKIEIASISTSWWYHAPRLALQPGLMALALWAGGWIGRPTPTSPPP